MLKRFLLLIFIHLVAATWGVAQVITVCTWNLKDFGKSKTDDEISYIAGTLKDFDIVAIQEVVAGDGGAQTVAQLQDVLNRKGAKWDYTISNPTSGSYKTERYAYLWKTKKITKVGNAWLEKNYAVEIEREPYFCTFKSGNLFFTLVNFHAVTKSQQPEREIKYFKFMPAEYASLNLIFCGDFNCPSTHTVFNPLKSLGYTPALQGQKTSLRQCCINDDCLASAYDNIFYNSYKIKIVEAGIVHFYKDFVSFDAARHLSDHVPVYIKFSAK
ncbi:MAG: endonuclease/exonuclease/phosphatase family protein [Bacteroidetes bacterium]|nr:endonuclease/exonuclease/phosphatase family protein [Bacteroidota bacterium]HRV52610.1 endonuclease/exonuclease/phosphatase family protein [Bacteroidia bacterium]